MECKDFCEYASKCKGDIKKCSGDHTEYVKQLENELSKNKLLENLRTIECLFYKMKDNKEISDDDFDNLINICSEAKELIERKK